MEVPHRFMTAHAQHPIVTDTPRSSTLKPHTCLSVNRCVWNIFYHGFDGICRVDGWNPLKHGFPEFSASFVWFYVVSSVAENVYQIFYSLDGFFSKHSRCPGVPLYRLPATGLNAPSHFVAFAHMECAGCTIGVGRFRVECDGFLHIMVLASP